MKAVQKRVPRQGDVIFVSGLTGGHRVTAVNLDNHTANAHTVADPLIVTLGIEWDLIAYPDEITD
jgi:hypothetical protein